MKKLLLSLGTAAAVVAPMATVVACGSSDDKAKDTTPSAISESITAIEALAVTSDLTEVEAKAVTAGSITDANTALTELKLTGDASKIVTSLKVGVEFVGVSYDTTKAELTLELAEEAKADDATSFDDAAEKVESWEIVLDIEWATYTLEIQKTFDAIEDATIDSDATEAPTDAVSHVDPDADQIDLDVEIVAHLQITTDLSVLVPTLMGTDVKYVGLAYDHEEGTLYIEFSLDVADAEILEAPITIDYTA